MWGRVEGPPVRGSLLGRGAGKDEGDDADDGNGDFAGGGKDGVPNYAQTEELGLIWTVAYYVLLFAGPCGFYKGLWRLTESRNALASF